jgi:hypothetical protein
VSYRKGYPAGPTTFTGDLEGAGLTGTATLEIAADGGHTLVLDDDLPG